VAGTKENKLTKKRAPPKYTYHFADLPLTKLHYVKCGKGKPLLIVPATISEIENWIDLIQYFGQKFTVYFFELPGHGKSTKFKGEYDSSLVAETVDSFVDHLGFEKISLMGFSFGGILAMKSLNLISDKVDKVIMFAPCVTTDAVIVSKYKRSFVLGLVNLLKKDIPQRIFLSMMHNRFLVHIILFLLKQYNVENLDYLKHKLLRLKRHTLQTLLFQIDEILTIHFSHKTFNKKLFFGMSIYDPLLDYKTTKKELQKFFKDMYIQEFRFPYHQPPKPFTFDELNEKFGDFVNIVSDQ